MSISGIPSEISMMRAAFFTRPQFCPSGVSDGHSLPHCVGCRSRASKWGWLLVRDDVTLLRCDVADMFDVLSNNCDTPARPPTQFPVASACSSLWVRRSGRMDDEILRSSLFLPQFLSSWYFRSLIRLLKLVLNRSSIRSPESLSLLLA